MRFKNEFNFNFRFMNYATKAKDSFKTKWNLFCFSVAIERSTDFSLEGFKEFKICDKLIKIYTSQYHQYNVDDEIESIRLTPDEIYIKLKDLDHRAEKAGCLEYYVSTFDTVFSKDDFEEVTSQTSCYYCGLSLKDFKLLYNQHQIFKKANRGFNLELDRKHPNLEYTKENCVMACYWCNNAKTDEFTAKEFESIGKAIGRVMKGRLNNN